MNVKTATKGYPKAAIMQHVEEIKGKSAEKRAARRARRGKSVAFEKTFKVGTKSVMLTAAGNNKKVPLLLLATASSMIEGEEHVKQWSTINAAGELTTHELRTKQPEMHAIYRKYMNLIDVHNKLRQGERSMADAWRTQSWPNRHFAEMLGFTEVNIYLSLKFFKKGRWAKMSHTEFRRRLAHAFMTLGKDVYPGDVVDSSSSQASGSSFQTLSVSTPSTEMSADSASGLFAGPSFEHNFVSFDKERRSLHTCAYCGCRTTKYCLSCLELGRGSIAVCGRKSGRSCIDDHAVGKPIQHGSWQIVCKKRNTDGSSDASHENTQAQRPRRTTRSAPDT